MKINEYPNEQLTFQDESYYDIDFWTGSGYESKKILGSTIKTGIVSQLVDIYGIPPIAQFASIDFTPASTANWNGVSPIRTPVEITINQRYTLRQFRKTGNRRGFFVQFQVPEYFRLSLNKQFQVTIVWATQDATAGNVYWNVGMTRPTLTQNFGGQPTTQWITNAEPIVGALEIQKMEYIFDSTDMQHNDPITLMVFRDNQNVLDTFGEDAYVHSVKIEQLN